MVYFNFQKWFEAWCFYDFIFEMGFALQRHIFFEISIPKSGANIWYFYIFWLLNEHGMYFFDILTSKSHPTLGYIVNFDLEMYFAPQRHADILTSKSGPRMVYFVDLEIYFAW